MIDKLRECFSDMVVYKDLAASNFFNSLSLPAFLRDWMLKKFQGPDGQYNIEEVSEFVETYLPRFEDWTKIKNRVIYENERVEFLTRISVDIDIRTQEISFSLPVFGLTSKETIIETDVWEACKEELIAGREVWGLVEIGYRYPNPDMKIQGKIKLTDFTNFCPYTIDLDYFKEMRNEFSTEEWIDILLGAIDYNAAGYENQTQKLTMLSRLLPFVEKRLNLIEMAQPGTGKSTLFGQVSRYGWLVSGGSVTRAKMFYDMSKRSPGIIATSDFVALDEIQAMDFPDGEEMRSSLQGYLEQGNYTVGTYSGVSYAGMMLLGNINKDQEDEYKFLFKELPLIFRRDGALLDRFHGFIKGWDIPRMDNKLKVCGWALNSEYYCSIMHMLRDDISYRAIVDQLVTAGDNEKQDTRDIEAVLRISTAYLKLLFPNVRSVEDVNIREFKMYCLRPAIKMRQIVLRQIGMFDERWEGKMVPSLAIKDEYSGV